MYIKIDVKTTESNFREFPVNLKDLKEVINTSYLGLGTPYEPIPIDNFVDLKGSQFPTIPAKAKITVELCPKDANDKGYKSSDPKLVCCIVKNVGRTFNDHDHIAKEYWKKIFDVDSKHILSAPDGTLYIETDKKNRCEISTKKKFPDAYVAYSILLSLIIEHKDGYKRRYYFMLDPVIHIRANQPK